MKTGDRHFVFQSCLLFLVMTVMTELVSCNSKYGFNLQKLGRHIIKGEVAGLSVDSVKLTLVPDAQGKSQDVDIYPPGGYFQFPYRIPEGTKFHVYVTTDPNQNTCTLKSSHRFVVQESMPRVNVSCVSHPVGVYDLITHLASTIDEDEEGTGEATSGGQ